MAPGDALLHVTPISHGSGYLYLPTWCSGGINVLVDHFDAGETLEIFERERIAYVLAVPTMLNLMVRHPDARTRDFSALKVLQTGGAPVQARTRNSPTRYSARCCTSSTDRPRRFQRR